MSTHRCLLVLLIMVPVMLSGCAPKLRHGKVCQSSERCARGLECLESRCHTPQDSELNGVSPTFIDLKRRPAFPKETETLPNSLLSLLRDLEAPLEIEPFLSDPLPSKATLPGGVTLAPAATYKFLQELITLLKKVIPTLKLLEPKTLKPQQAESMAKRLGFHAVRATNGVPIVIGAIATSGESQVTIPFLRSADRIDHDLGRVALDLRQLEGEGFPVSFACIASAFCPADEDAPVRQSPGPWSDVMEAALAGVRAPLDAVRREIKADMLRVGIRAEPMVPGDEYDMRPTVLVLANPLKELSESEMAWLNGLREDGTGIIVLISGARVRATKRQAVATDNVSQQLLSYFELQHQHALISDSASLVALRYPGADGLPLSTPLSVDIAKSHPTHPVTAGLHQVNLPLAGGLVAPPAGAAATAIAWSRAAVRPVTLPIGLAEVTADSAKAAPGVGGPSVLAVAGMDTARWVVIRSSLGLPSMTASVLLGGVELEGGRPVAQVAARVKAYEAASGVYARGAQLNRPLIRNAAKFLLHAARWAGEGPLSLRLAPEEDRPVAKVEPPPPPPAPKPAEGEEAGGAKDAPAEAH
ncbi:MAG: hypothetical protein VX938_06385 [Myxococcota bacterium]|nr:hypothetical protein [Myxococcota bacterium]